MKGPKRVHLDPTREDLSPEAKAAVWTCVAILVALLLGAWWCNRRANQLEYDGDDAARSGRSQEDFRRWITDKR